MIRQEASFKITSKENFKQQMLSWANQFNICCLLDSHHYQNQYSTTNCLLAVNAINSVSIETNSLAEIQEFYNNTNDWMFGNFNYDFKNYLLNTQSNHTTKIPFSDAFLFQPQIVVQLFNASVTIGCINCSPNQIFAQISNTHIPNSLPTKQHINIQAKISKQQYLQTIQKIQQHIQLGDCYEMNFCQEFYAEDVSINTLNTYQKLMQISPNPFSCYYKYNQQYLLCASPERFLKKQQNTLISQPIKGTQKRDVQNPYNDNILKQQLSNSKKDRSENVMIVDLVRNDLSKICQAGTVTVQELFGIYSFPQVHQIISTITGTLKNNTNLIDILKATFPMGSMTGAPKNKVIQLTEQYEQSKRGIYSGCVGYITPNKNFDFNVVIRSLMYNAATKYLSYQVGGGITIYSQPQVEYDECLLKAEALKKVLE